MAITDFKLTETDFASTGAEALPDKVVGQAEYVKGMIDGPSKDVIMPKYNGALDAVQAAVDKAQKKADAALPKTGGTMTGSIHMSLNDIGSVGTVNAKRVDAAEGFYTSQGKFGQNGPGIQGAWQNTHFAALNFSGSGYVPVVASNIPSSSRRYKKNIKPLPLETAYKILDAVAVEFDWKKDSGYKGRSISFIAEDIAEIDPRYAYTANYVTREATTHVDPETGETVTDSPAEYGERVEGLTQNAIIAAQHEVIKDHDRKIAEQQKQIDGLQKRIEALEV